MYDDDDEDDDEDQFIFKFDMDLTMLDFNEGGKYQRFLKRLFFHAA